MRWYFKTGNLSKILPQRIRGVTTYVWEEQRRQNSLVKVLRIREEEGGS